MKIEGPTSGNGQ